MASSGLPLRTFRVIPGGRGRGPGKVIALRADLAEAGMEVTSRATAVRSGLEELARRAWAMRDPWTLHRVEKVLREVGALETEGRRIAGWAEANGDPDHLMRPGHGRAA